MTELLYYKKQKVGWVFFSRERGDLKFKYLYGILPMSVKGRSHNQEARNDSESY
jgi:hypothetical protein